MALALIGLLAVVAATLRVERPAEPAPAALPAMVAPDVATDPQQQVARVTPTTLRIPAIGVTTPLVDLGLDATGALAAPAVNDRAGWFAAGPAPGEPGPAVVAGHVDSRAGPAVFFRLKELRAGDTVEVDRSDGSTVTFRVASVAVFPKDRFPTADVYGPTPVPELRLVTCGGPFDRAGGRYLDNVIVHAVPL